LLPKSVTPIALGTSEVPPWRAYWSAADATLSGGFENSNPGGGASEYVSIVNASVFGVSAAVVKRAWYVRFSGRPADDLIAPMLGLPTIVIWWFLSGWNPALAVASSRGEPGW
jgi:hypothetical protein